ncbi:MAG: hypothetical protein JOZ52_04035 [Acidobacteria bacterium]|nr:hypothetical protein [Acidobacteriota bacterium]
MCLVLLLTAAFPVAAQRRRHRSFWKKHRDKITTVAGAAAGAGIGGLAGGKKGALIGTAVGAGGSALYTYKLRKKHRRRY